MSYVFVEREVENLLRTGILAVIATYNGTDPEPDVPLAPTYRRFWSDDDAEAYDEQIKFPLIQIGAAPNTPRGYQEPLRQVPVILNIATLLIEDPKREMLANLYNTIRQAIDERDWNQDTTLLHNVEIDVSEGGEILEDDRTCFATLNLTAEVCVE
jgi:hypothetical protein